MLANLSYIWGANFFLSEFCYLFLFFVCFCYCFLIVAFYFIVFMYLYRYTYIYARMVYLWVYLQYIGMQQSLWGIEWRPEIIIIFFSSIF